MEKPEGTIEDSEKSLAEAIERARELLAEYNGKTLRPAEFKTTPFAEISLLEPKVGVTIIYDAEADVLVMTDLKEDGSVEQAVEVHMQDFVER